MTARTMRTRVTLRSHQHPIRLAMTKVRHSDSISVDPRQAVRVSRPRKCRSFSDALNVPFVSPNSIVEFVYGRSPPDLVSENLACADGSTPRFLLLSPTSDCLGAIRETPLVPCLLLTPVARPSANMRRGENLRSQRFTYPAEAT